MDNDETERRKEEILARIKDPTVREHYRAQLDMHSEWGDEGIAMGFSDVLHESRSMPDEAQGNGVFDRPLVVEKVPPEIARPRWHGVALGVVLGALLVILALALIRVWP